MATRFEAINDVVYLDKPADLCNDPEVDAITRTEWGNAFIFKGSDNCYYCRFLHRNTS